VANHELVEQLRKGSDAWNAWRRQRIESQDPMFSTFEMIKSRADLSFVEFPPDTKLDKADLSGVNLFGARLKKVSLSRADLHSADLRNAILSDATLHFTDLVGANLSNSKLVGAGLSNTYLQHANLTHADLSGAILLAANLEDADLTDAELIGAMLSQTLMTRATLTRTDLSQAMLSEVVFADADLSSAIGLETCEHLGPSVIDFRTLKSSHGLPTVFLRGIGLPDDVIKSLPSLLGQAVYPSCFISYSTKDDDFAKQLYADLQNSGVRCWFAPEHLRIGDNIFDVIDVAIRQGDKVILVLSENSIKSGWVKDEVMTAYEVERTRIQTVVFPIRLDDAVNESDEPWAAKLRSRHIGDFSKWKNDDDYQHALKRVLRDLGADLG
jgi:uncharacterized protein YjbI with pentapeptide repeats